MKELYPAVVKGSILEQARLTIHMIPGLAECEECDEIFNVVKQKGYCPNCGSFEKTILSGKEFTIREIVVPEDGQTAENAPAETDEAGAVTIVETQDLNW